MNNNLKFNSFTWEKNEDGTVSLKDARGLVGKDPTYIEIPETISEDGRELKVTRILEDSFKLCFFAKKIIIPSTVMVIEESFSANCPFLEVIEVDDGNKWFAAKDGALYTKDFSLLICFPGNRTDYETIPDKTELTDGSLGENPYIVHLPTRFREQYERKEWELDDDTMTARCRLWFNYLADENGDIVVPEKVVFDGKTYIVNTIPSYSFRDKTRHVTLPDSIECIEDFAFKDFECESINLPKHLKSIGEIALFPLNDNEELVLPPSLTFVGHQAFNKGWNLKHLTLPNDIEDISFIYDFVHLEEITLIEGQSGERTLTMDAGVLLTADRKWLIKYPVSKQDSVYTIPDGVEYILTAAFYNNKYLEKVVMPDTVKGVYGIGINACSYYIQDVEFMPGGFGNYFYWPLFEGCSALKEVVLSKNLTQITSDLIAPGQKTLFIPKNTTVYLNGTSIEDIIIEEGHPSYFMHDGCLYKKETNWRDEVSIKLLFVPDSLEIDELHVMEGCTGMDSLCNKHVKRLFLPKTLTDFAYRDNHMPNLEEVIVEEGNPNFMTIDGVLYGKTISSGERELRFIPEGKNVEVFRIDESAHSIYILNNRFIKKIVIPKTLKTCSCTYESNLPALETVEVEAGNEQFFVDNDCLFTEFVAYGYQGKSTYRFVIGPRDKAEWAEKAAKLYEEGHPSKYKPLPFDLDGKHFICEPFHILVRIDDQGRKYAKGFQTRYKIHTWEEEFCDEDTGEVQMITQNEREPYEALSDEFELTDDCIFGSGGDWLCGKVELKPITKYIYDSGGDKWCLHFCWTIAGYRMVWGGVIYESHDSSVDSDFEALKEAGYRYDFF